MVDSEVVRSPALPGNDLIAAVLNREVMGLADRGGASGLVGQRWADLCAAWAARWPGHRGRIPGQHGGPFVVERVVRLDATPAIAAAASKRGLQNPDLLLLGRRDGRQVIQAADAKFSVETARSKQVSPAVVEALLGLSEVIGPAVGDLPAELDLAAGVFLCPDFPLTHLMLRRRQGIVRVTVSSSEVVLVPAPARAFITGLEGAAIMPPLAAVDRLPVRIDESLLAALYYFRLARAAVGFWTDAVKPLLLFNDRIEVDEAAVRAEAERRAIGAESAWELVLQWNADVETVRAERAAVEQVAGLPMLNRELRELVERVAAEQGVEPPSLNQVRRRLGAWFRGELRERVGPLLPPVADFVGALERVGREGAALAPRVEPEARRIVLELIEAGANGGEGEGGAS